MASSTSRPSVFECHPKLTIAVVVVVSVLTLDILSANLLSALGWYTPPRKLEQVYRVPHAVFHHTLAPDIDYPGAVWGPMRYDVHTNSLGFKDSAARQVPLKSDGRRVLFMGDSFTEAMGVSYADSFVGLLDRRLGERRVEVLNAAVSSYSPIIYFRKIKYLLENVGLEFNHAVVMIDISDIMDEAISYVFDAKGNVYATELPGAVGAEDRFKNFIAENTILLSHIRFWFRSIRSRVERARPVQESLNQYRSAWTFDETAYLEYGKRGLTRAAAHMTALKELLDSTGIKLTVVVYPWPDQIARRDLDSRQVEFWRRWSNQHETSFVNLFPDFINAQDPMESIRTYFISGDVHWNARGHALVAERLLKRIQF